MSSEFLPLHGIFPGNVDGNKQEDDGNIYDILFEYVHTEEWCQDKYDNNATNTYTRIGDIILRFINNFAGGSFFSGQVAGIQSNEKRKCKFDEDVYIHNYTLYKLQAYSTNQTVVYNDNDKEDSSNNASDDDDEGNRHDENDANEPVEN